MNKKFTIVLCLIISILAGCSKEQTPPAFATDLSYADPVLETLEGTSAKGSVPTLKGSDPFSFNVTTLPQASFISIDQQGAINVSAQAVPGSYSATVKVINQAGTQTFENIFTVLINSKSGVTFVKDILPITQQNCSFAGCHPNFLKHQEVAGTITKMLDRVQRPQGSSGAMPRERDPLSATQIATMKQWVADGMKER